MLVYRNFRDIPTPLIIKKSALTEKRADLFSAFPHKEVFIFTLSFDPALMVKNAFLRFHSDDDGRVMEIPCKRMSGSAGRDLFSADFSAAYQIPVLMDLSSSSISCS